MTMTSGLVHVPRQPMPPFGPRLKTVHFRCGRPRVRGKGTCKAKPMYGIEACGDHASYEERSRSISLVQRYLPVGGLIRRLDETSGISSYPACWSWPVAAEVREQVLNGAAWEALVDWQNFRCAACGGEERSPVMDHDHVTGWIRGWLCQSCNLREPGAALGDTHPISRRLVRYRRWNPARILGVWERYDHPLRGEDRGRLGGQTTTKPHPVNTRGRVLIDGDRYFLLAPGHPADIADELFEQEMAALVGAAR